jgi:hypothetical protein
VPSFNELKPILAAFAGRNVLGLGGVQHGDADLGDEALVLLPGLDVDGHEQNRVLGFFGHGSAEVEVGEFGGHPIDCFPTKTQIALDSLDGPAPFPVRLDTFRAVPVGPLAPLPIGTGTLEELLKLLDAKLGYFGQVVIRMGCRDRLAESPERLGAV